MVKQPPAFQQGTNWGVLALPSLRAWLSAAERWWTDDPDHPEAGWYGSGFTAWGAQTVQKYAAAAATVAVWDDDEQAARRAAAAIRFSLQTHRSGKWTCADGRQWGHSWISALGLERWMFAVGLLGDRLDDDLRTALRRVLISEADWLSGPDHFGADGRGIVAGLWAAEGANKPESNLWSGSLLWRTAAMFPDQRNADRWRRVAELALLNAVSVPGDADDDSLVDEVRIADAVHGANFFPSMALDHHDYLNLGYMVICMSQAAMLHFDLAAAGLPRPAALDHHQDQLWQAVKRCVTDDGRLIRIGGDSRVRYAYCQEYLMPALAYAADVLDDPDALGLLQAQIALIDVEQRSNADGSYYGTRLADLGASSPYYYTRLESDRACALAMGARYADQVRRQPPGGDTPPDVDQIDVDQTEVDQTDVDQDVTWVDHDHGLVLHRGRTRFASFSWRAWTRTQGLCFPTAAGDLAEWDLNLCPVISSEGATDGARSQRRVASWAITPFAGGFLTHGVVEEGVDTQIAEGWRGGPVARSRIALAALPDSRTVVGIHRIEVGDGWLAVLQAYGLNLGVPNDVYNRGRRYTTASTSTTLPRADADAELPLGDWVSIDDQLGVIALGAGRSKTEELILSRSARRRGGPFDSLSVDTLRLGGPPPGEPTSYHRPGEQLVRTGFAVVCSTPAEDVRRAAARQRPVPSPEPDVDIVSWSGEQDYLLLAHWSGTAEVEQSAWPDGDWVEIAATEDAGGPGLPGARVRLLRRA